MSSERLTSVSGVKIPARDTERYVLKAMAAKFGPQPGDDAAEYWQAAHDAEKEYGDNLRATIAALQSEIARMREALKPFAKEADAWPDHVWEGHGLGHSLSVSVTIGHLRAARAALSAPEVTRKGDAQ
jgi:uncharacterized small protein (DUF1192 family)